MLRVLAGAVAMLFSVAGAFAADEPDNRTPVEKYQADIYMAQTTCSIKFKIAMLRAEAGSAEDEDSNYRKCIVSQKAATKTSLAKALKTVKKVKAQEALKTYHVAAIAALEGISPGLDERKINYEQRQEALKGKMTEAWARFEVEQ